MAQMMFCGGASAGAMWMAMPALFVGVLCFGALLALGFTDESTVVQIRAGRVEFDGFSASLQDVDADSEGSVLTVRAHSHAFRFRAPSPDEADAVVEAIRQATETHGDPSEVPVALGTLTERS